MVTIGGFFMLAWVLVLANTENEGIDVTVEVAEAAGPGLDLIHGGLVGIDIGIIVMIAR